MTQKILHQSCWTRSTAGKKIELFSSEFFMSGNQQNSESRRPILMMGGLHGDEPEGVRLAYDLVDFLSKEESAYLDFINPWVLIPCLNIDGYCSSKRVNDNGVDLNRNFPTKDWSAKYKSERYFPGKEPASEIETKAFIQLIEDIKPSLIVHFHSWEPSVVYTGLPGKGPAEMIAKESCYEAKEDIGYPTPGSLGQYGWHSKGIPVLCLEAQEKSDLENIWPRWGLGLTKFLKTKWSFEN